MDATSSEKGGVHYDGEAPPSNARRGSIYQVIPPSERRMSAQGRRISVIDDIFGEIKEGGPNYRNVGWLGTAVLMIKTQIGLGVLSIPAVLDTLGMGPGLVVVISIGVITTWSNYVIGTFKKNHPSVYGIDDVGYKLFGKAGREFFYVVFVLFWIFVAGAGMLGISISFNAISTHGVCTAVFVAVAAIIGFTLGSIQTLHEVSWLAWVGAISILTAIFTLTIAVGVQDKPAAAPPGPFKSNWKGVGDPTFESAISACSSIVFAWAGTPAFFQIASEMRVPEQYTRSLLLCQSVVATTYIVIGVVVYYYCGSFVASPALGSAGVLLKKICYGLALPGLCVSTLLFVHIAAKYVFVRMLRGSYHLTDPTFRHWATWLGCTLGATIISYIIASAIPVFGGLVSLIGALLGTLMCFQPMGAMWLYDNWHNPRTAKWYAMVAWSVFVIVSGFFLMIGGTYGSVIDIKNSYAANGGSSPWSCADNSNST
ncbi:uncharacterized protein A1O9_03581 [Exophiala aquamarina CBS 119918]|uniref:Amino acid transporter transmembrane domain-containing protein n=1 Tax=Exophiala aquamarina CBS 119918 TaxID=1182545 RepID=A0A072PPH0_9EURO|nr:uncharacterized protein A1O9_03581 [Exophiala aquamarina CBS 119918]KEF62009.1 hypothetical protein A1O9_03581 [Exophiala aquamarina CBS 119918]